MKSVKYKYLFHETPVKLEGSTLCCPECESDKLTLQGSYSYFRNGKKNTIHFINGPPAGIPQEDMNEVCSSNPSNGGNAIIQHFKCDGCGKTMRLAFYAMSHGINVRWMDRCIPSRW